MGSAGVGVTVNVTLSVAENSELIGLVQALAGLERQHFPDHALIGGFAVMTRLAQAHRVTLDVDHVLRETVPSTVHMLVARQAAQRVGLHLELPGGVDGTSSPRSSDLSRKATSPRAMPIGCSF